MDKTVDSNRLLRIHKELHKVISDLKNPSDELRRIHVMRNSFKYKEYFTKKYSWLNKEAPTLLQMVIDPKTDPKIFNKLYSSMFMKVHDISNGTIEKDDAEIKMGDELFKEYVEPLVPKMKEKDPNEPQVLVGDTPLDITEEELRQQIKK